MLLDAGTLLGRYKILNQIGAGGMGVVYLAEDTKLEREVALKILPTKFAEDTGRMRRFIQEAKTLSKLNHPGIITIHEIAQADSIHFIATEYIHGKTLRQRIRQKDVRLDEAIDIATQVAGALAEAHDSGIIHRDIKPENIMVRRDRYVKILDFGLAKLGRQTPGDLEAATRTISITEPGIIMGTVAYMSPEQARGHEVDARSDIWSFGIVLYEMVAGHTPFPGETQTDILTSILHKEPLPLEGQGKVFPPELADIIAKSLHKDKAQRYQSIKELLHDLRQLKHKIDFKAELEQAKSTEIVGELPATKEPEKDRERAAISDSGTRYLARPSLIQMKMVVASMAFILLVGVAFVYFKSVSSNKAEIESVAVLPFINAGADPDTEYLSDGITESLINRLSQLPKLKIIARSSVFNYKDREIDPQKVGNELGVQAILTGRVAQRGDTLSISVELVDTRSRSHLWGAQYNRKVADIPTLDEELSREISENLRPRLTNEEQKRIVKEYTANTEAYQLYLKGRYFNNKRTAEGYQKGIEYFNQAIDKDPNYALAYAGLALSYDALGRLRVISPQEAYIKSKAAATQALKIDDALSEAHTALALAAFSYEWNWADAEKESKQAIAFDPNNSRAHAVFSYYLSAMGRHEEALTEIRRAQEIDPLSLSISKEIGIRLYHARRYDEALAQYQRTLEMDDKYYDVHFWIAEIYSDKGMYNAALAELKKATSLAKDISPGTLAAAMDSAEIKFGWKAYWQQVIDIYIERSKTSYVPAYDMADCYNAIGDKEKAIEYLNKAYDERFPSMVYINVYPAWDSLRDDPRFKALVGRIGLTP
jgi:eukaryotic-like serine/threonine-protein kinase